MDADLLVSPVVLWAHGQVTDIFELAKDGFRPALPSMGQNDLLRGPRVPIGDEDSLAEDLRFQRLEGGVIDPPGQPVGPPPLPVVDDL